MKIPSLNNMIFVFGSNLSGIHGAGAAKYAREKRGAIWGVGEGFTGKCYALPTKGLNIYRMYENEVQSRVQRFMKNAYDYKNLNFQITQIGCGLSGFTKEQIAPMFEYCAYKDSNCYFDNKWKDLLPDTAKFWGTL